MITIKVPEKFIHEKDYVINFLFSEIFTCKCVILKGSTRNYEIILNNGSKLIIEDHFFDKINPDDTYIKESNIPKNITFSMNEFTHEKDIPVIYGRDKVVKSSNMIICGIDIISSIFFMLTRWEELAVKERDKHGRFPSSMALAVKHGFIKRPVVNEYIEMLYNMLTFLDPNTSITRNSREFNFFFSHDIDEFKKYNGVKSFKRHIGNIGKRKSFDLFVKDIIEHAGILIGKKDPYDVFDEFMTMSEGLNSKSSFFFMTNGESIHDMSYDINSSDVRKCIKRVLKRGHKVGIHYSYDFFKEMNLRSGITLLEKVSGININSGRAHFLKAGVESLSYIADCSIEEDHSMGYPDYTGFRCGICYPFKPFDIKNRITLEMREIPLILMDTTLVLHKKLSKKECLKEINYYYETIKKYGGTYSILIHNSTGNRFFKYFNEMKF